MTRVPWKTRAAEEVEVDVEGLVAGLLSKVVAVPDGPMITPIVDVTVEFNVVVNVLRDREVSVTVLGLELPVKYSP